MLLKQDKLLSRRKAVVSLAVILVLIGTLFSGCGPSTVPRGWSGVAVGNGTLFLGTMEGKLVALNISDGKEKWSVSPETQEPWSISKMFSPPKFFAIYGTPTVEGDSVYIGSLVLAAGNKTGRIFSFPIGGVEPRWIFPAQGYLDGAMLGSAVISQGRVFFGCTNGKVYALDATSGEKKWEFATGAEVWGTPAIKGDTLFIGSFDNRLYALDVATGSERWHFEADGAIIARPLAHNDNVYFGTYSRNFYALNASTGKEKWRFTATGGFWANPLGSGDTIYAPSLDGKLYICDAATGRDLGALTLGKLISSSPVLVEGAVIVTPQEGKLFAIATNVNREVELKKLEATVNSPLSVSDGIIYIHSEKPEKLIGLTSKGAEVWPALTLRK